MASTRERLIDGGRCSICAFSSVGPRLSLGRDRYADGYEPVCRDPRNILLSRASFSVLAGGCSFFSSQEKKQALISQVRRCMLLPT